MCAEAPQDAQVGEESPRWLQWSRNGRRMACLPCRRRKLACDHSLPTCQRCQKAKKTVSCVYEPPADTPSKKQKRTDPSPPELVDGMEAPLPPPPTSDSSPSIVESRSVKPVEFLGPTSIPTFIQEVDGQLLPCIQTTTAQDRTGLPLCAAEDAPSGIVDTGLAKNLVTDMAVETLQCIPDQQTCSALIRRCRDPADGWISQIVHRLSISLHDTFKPHHDRMRRANLTRLAMTLTSNVSTAVEEGPVNMEQWLASISGPNLRWECVGILFCFCAAAYSRNRGDYEGEDLPSSPTEASQPHQRQPDPSQRYMQCVHHCIDLCSRVGAGSSLLVYLLLKAAYLTSIHYGNASLVADRLLGECVTVSVSLGMHVCSSPNTTSFLTEVRRRLFAHVFVMDKNGAILTGRPPRLSRRYCSAPLPLDVSDEVVLAMPGDPVPIAEVASGLVDAYGWNTQGAVYRATLIRARNLFSHIRDEILETALSVNHNLDAGALRNLKARQESLYASLPPTLYTHSDPASVLAGASTRYSQSLARLDHLQNLFFINRLLVKAASLPAASSPSSHLHQKPLSEADVYLYSRELVRVSYDTLVVMLGFWHHGNYGPSTLLTNFDWLVLGFACPAAGVLCGELLRPSSPPQNLQLRQEQQSFPPMPEGPRRSDIVHHLSLLSGFLTRIGPGSANASLWNGVKDVIHRVLDQLLNTAPDFPADVVVGGGLGDGLAVTTATMHHVGVPDDFHDDFHDLFAFELLDSFSWLQS